jgi:hypothetical protein
VKGLERGSCELKVGTRAEKTEEEGLSVLKVQRFFFFFFCNLWLPEIEMKVTKTGEIKKVWFTPVIPATHKAEAGGSQVQGQSGLHMESLSGGREEGREGG